MLERDASIVLIGTPGCGKSTLAIIAQVSLGLQHVDVDELFHKETGLSAPQFRKQLANQNNRSQWLAFLENVLTAHSKHCVIVWPRDCVDEPGLSLLKRYRDGHPVILVQRDTDAAAKYLQLSDSTKLARISELILPLYRACSNLEYFNLDDVESLTINGHPTPDLSASRDNHQTPCSLRLKRVEETFLRLLNSIRTPELQLPRDLHRPILPQSRATYTYMLMTSISLINSVGFDLRYLKTGADAIQLEVRLDPSGFNNSPALSKKQISRAFALVTRAFDGPVVYHINPASGKLSKDSIPLYLDLLRHGLRLGADIATVQLGLSDELLNELISLSKTTRLLGMHHEDSPGATGWTSVARQNILAKATKLGFEGVRLTQPALSANDNHEANSFAVSANRKSESKPLVIAYNTGFLGRTSRCFNQVLTPVTTEELQNHALKAAGMSSLASEITIQQAQRSLYASFVYDPMKYYIVGLDVAFSVSPVIHNAAHEFFGMPHRLHIQSCSTLEQVRHLTNDDNFGGLTVAQGFKRVLYSQCAATSTDARNIGAINTLLPIRKAWDYTKPPPQEFWANRNRAGPVLDFYGENIDWVGMTRCIKQNLSPANVITRSSTALVVGAGGMARAAIYALLMLGMHHIVLYNRTYEHASTLAEHFSKVQVDASSAQTTFQSPVPAIQVCPSKRRDIRVLDSLEANWPDDLAQPTVVVCCIPVPDPLQERQNQFLLPPQWMRNSTGGVVVDMNYRVLLTPLLRQVHGLARHRWVAVDGLESFTQQACAQFEVFTCRKAPKELMRKVVLQHWLEVNQGDAEVCQYIERQLRR